MYLAKFFHRSPGDDDRELLLMPGGDPVITGIYMDEGRATKREDFLRKKFSSMKAAAAARWTFSPSMRRCRPMPLKSPRCEARA